MSTPNALAWRATTILMMVWLPSAVGAADPVFATTHLIEHTGSDTPLFIDGGDLDGDGDTDILYVSPLRDIQVVHNLDGQGREWSSPMTGAINSHSMDTVQAVDLNGDGLDDVLWSSASGTKAGWFRNLGANAGFASSETIATNTPGRGITAMFEFSEAVAADFDGDGDLDVATVSARDEIVAWHRNTGGVPLFSDPILILDAWEPGGLGGVERAVIRAGDMDGDGDTDLVWGLHKYGMRWAENIDGAGTFAVANLALSGPAALELLDLEQDGDLDIVHPRWSGLRLGENRGEDGFEWSEIPNPSPPPFQVLVSDADADGDHDIVVAIAEPATEEPFAVWLENTDGYETPSVPRLLFQGDGPRPAIAQADVDGDGDTDWITAGADVVRWFETRPPDGGLAPAHQVSLHAFYAEQMGVADIDGDGDIDLFIQGLFPPRIFIYENLTGFGAFATRARLSAGGPVASQRDVVHAVDMDADGDLDLASLVQREYGSVWFESVSPEHLSFTARPIPIPGGYINSFSDLDGDDDLDLVHVLPGYPIYWNEFLGDSLRFTESMTVGSGEMVVEGFRVLDLDGDGDPDILPSVYVADESEGPVGWYENTGGPIRFGAFHPIPGEFTGNTVRLNPFDLDGDGDFDLLVRANGMFSLEWMEGVGAFASPEMIDSSGASDVRFQPLNSDAAPDLIYRRGTELLWRLDQDGTLGLPQSMELPAVPSQLVISDVDLDGDADLVATFDLEQALVWFEQIDEVTFSPPRPILTANGEDIPVSEELLFQLADLDGDQDQDLVVVGRTNSLVLWLENSTNAPAFPSGLQLLGE